MPTVGKIMERLIHTQCSNYLKGHKILTDSQSGFRAGAVYATKETKSETSQEETDPQTVDHQHVLKELKSLLKFRAEWLIVLQQNTFHLVSVPSGTIIYSNSLHSL